MGDNYILDGIQDHDEGRKSSGVSRLPIWMRDYVTTKHAKQTGSSNCIYSISDNLYYANLSKAYQSYLDAFSVHTEHASFKEASQDSRWIEVMQHEINGLQENHTWDIIDLLLSKQAIGSKWVYKIKYKANGEVDKFKARLVAKGYN